MRRSWLKILSVLLLSLFICNNSLAQDHSVENDSLGHKNEVKEKFDVGEFIFDHILDQYGWHLFTYHHKHITIPLPVILKSKSHGWNIFYHQNSNMAIHTKDLQ